MVEGKENPLPAGLSAKYDILPPRSQPDASSATTSPNPIPTAIPPNILINSAELLVTARAKLAASQAQTPPPPAPEETKVQVFALTRLKTIKCDICQKKNTDILYKCQSCAVQHQLCRYCVENTEPKPAEGSTRRYDWSVHARLRNAHADYHQPVCLSRRSDGSYVGDGIEFLPSRAKRINGQRFRKKAPVRSAGAVDRNAAARHAIGRNKTTEQARRIQAMAKALVEVGTSEEVRETVEFARTRRAADALLELRYRGGNQGSGTDMLDTSHDEDMSEDEDIDIEGPQECSARSRDAS